MKMYRLVEPAALFVALAALFLSSAASAQGKWEVITREQGVVVSEKEVAGRDLPIFKGTTTINASVVEILAVLDDTSRNTQWMHQCMDARMLKQINDLERIVYNRTDAPWPVDDRDVVIRSKLTIDRENRKVIVRFNSIQSPLMPEVSDAVRMPTLKGHYIFTILDFTKTQVEYQIDADPGGMLPDWLISATSKEIPLNTLVNMRNQVEKTRKSGIYKDFVKARSEQFGFTPEAQQK